MESFHLSGRKICDTVLRKGVVWRGKTFVARSLSGVPPHKGRPQPNEPGIYLGTFASAKLHKSAVKRNRMRRRCREAIRLALKNIENPPSFQLLVTPRIASLDAPFDDIQIDVAHFLSQLPSWPR